MYISDKGIELLCEFEGFKEMMYNCPAGHATIGFGHKIHDGKINGDESEKPFELGITKEKGMELLYKDLSIYCECVSHVIKGRVLQPQFDAMVSLCYNIGCNAFKESSFARKINELKHWFTVWDKAFVDGGLKQLEGLKKRRAREWKYFSTVKKMNALLKEIV